MKAEAKWDHTIHKNHCQYWDAFSHVLFEVCFQVLLTVLYRSHNSRTSQFILLLSPAQLLKCSAVSEVQWQSCSSDKGGYWITSGCRGRSEGEKAAIITSSPACRADKPERHHLAVWKQRGDWLGDKRLHCTLDFSMLFCMFESRVTNYAISGSRAKDRTYERLSDQASDRADEQEKKKQNKTLMSHNVLYTYYVWTGRQQILIFVLLGNSKG